MEGQGYKHKLFHLNLQRITSVLEKFEYLQGYKLPSIPLQLCCATMCTVKPVYKDHSREPENMVFMSNLIVNIEYMYTYMLYDIG
jgi:hypothetical protein